MKYSTTYTGYVVEKKDFPEVLSHLKGDYLLGLDTETYGLGFYDHMFSLILCGKGASFYFNFYYGEDYLGDKPDQKYILSTKDIAFFSPLWKDERITWGIHNAKFDMQKMFLINIELRGNIHCSLASERLIKNNRPFSFYSLDKCCSRRGWKKDDKVEKLVQQQGLYKVKNIPGKKRTVKEKYYYKVPFDIISSYGLTDGILHRELALDQRKRLNVS